MTTTDLQGLLKQRFGYDEFRPGQEEIISNALAGRHSLVVMPTGGGKSCAISCRPWRGAG